MDLYKQLFFPALKLMDPEAAHEHTLAALEWGQRRLTRPFLRQIAGYCPAQPIALFGLTFPNVLGMAAGFDKDVRVAAGLAALGFGHIEVGTLTPRPQVGNPRPRIFRLPSDEALINRMGFPNEGVDTAVQRLRRLKRKDRDFVLGISLGKQKETPLAEAEKDYIRVMQKVYPYADYLAVNISSPNTPGLRELQGDDYLGHLLRLLTMENAKLGLMHGIKKRPLLVKIAPDLSEIELAEILAAIQANDIDGIIATNTTIRRDGLTDARREEAGGLSGRPLTARSNEIIHSIHEMSQGQLPIIGVGGVRTAQDVRDKLAAGASLVQLYTGLVYEGPRLPGRLLRRLAVGAE